MGDRLRISRFRRRHASVELVQRDTHGALTVRVKGSPIGVGAFAADRLFVSE